jgi:hypothetical protein
VTDGFRTSNAPGNPWAEKHAWSEGRRPQLSGTGAALPIFRCDLPELQRVTCAILHWATLVAPSIGAILTVADRGDAVPVYEPRSLLPPKNLPTYGLPYGVSTCSAQSADWVEEVK